MTSLPDILGFVTEMARFGRASVNQKREFNTAYEARKDIDPSILEARCVLLEMEEEMICFPEFNTFFTGLYLPEIYPDT